MNQPNTKLCIQKRIKMWLARTLRKVIFNPLYLFVLVLFLFVATYLILEILVVLKILAHSYFYYLQNLDYSRARDVVDLIVTADASIIAFTGVTATMILKHVLEEEKEGRKVGATTIVGKDQITSIAIDYRKKRREIIKFIEATLLAFVGSITFGLGTIITQALSFNVLLSITLLLVGIIELVAMIVYSLESEP